MGGLLGKDQMMVTPTPAESLVCVESDIKNTEHDHLLSRSTTTTCPEVSCPAGYQPRPTVDLCETH